MVRLLLLRVVMRLRSLPAMGMLFGICVGLSVSSIFIPIGNILCHQTDLLVNSDVEPVMGRFKLESASSTDQHKEASPRPVRPRFASTELGIREKLFIGVLSSVESVDNRAVAMNKTFGSISSKIIFFVIHAASANLHSTANSHHLPIVWFNDDAKMLDAVWFRAFQHVGEHYLSAYDWFFFARDDVYISAGHILDFVEHISVAERYWLGKPILLQSGGMAVCDTDVGVLMSNAMFAAVVQSLAWCSKRNFAGKLNGAALCLANVAKTQNFSCTDSVNEMVFQYYFDTTENVAMKFISASTETKPNKTMTVGRLKHGNEFFMIHRHLAELEILETRRQLMVVNANYLNTLPLTPDGNSSSEWPPGVFERTQPRTRFDVQRWHYFNDKYIYFDDDFTNFRELKGVDKEDIKDIVGFAVNRLSSIDRIQYRHRKIVNGYRRFDAARGTDYILDLELLSASGQNVLRRVELVRPLGAVEIVPTPYVTESTRIHILLPVTYDDRDSVLAFLDSYSRVCIDGGDNADLLLVLLYVDSRAVVGDVDPFAVIKSTVAFYESRSKHHTDARISWMPVHVGSSVTAYEAMSTSFNILDAVLRRFTSESLVFLCSIGMELSVELLNRVRMNTISGFQVFFPIGFWAYKPSLVFDQPPYPAKIDLTAKSGRFDPDRFDHTSFYCSDYYAARRQSTETGFMPSDLYALFVWYQPTVHVLRAVEPALRLQYREEPQCENDIRQCPSPRVPAGHSQLALLVFEHQQRLDRRQIDVMHKQQGENVDQMKPDMLRR